MSARTIGVIASLLCVAVLVGACGGDDDNGTEADGGQASTSETAAADCVAEATKRVEAASEEVPLKAPPAPLDLGALDGEKVWVVYAINTPLYQAMREGMDEAAGAAGLDIQHVIVADSNVNKINQGITQAVGQNAAGIVLVGVDPKTVSGPLTAAADQDIPVVDVTNPPDAPLDNLYAHITADFEDGGRKAAVWILADSGCDANAAVLTTGTIFPVLKQMTDGAIDEISTLCPDCTVNAEVYDVAKMATDLGSQTQSLLRSNPDINYLFPVMDAAVKYVVPAVQQAGLGDQVKIVSHDGVEENIDDIRNGGDGQVADVAFPPGQWIGWAIIDQVARGMTGVDSVDWTIPTRLIDESNVGESQADLFPEYQDVAQAFESAWSGD